MLARSITIDGRPNRTGARRETFLGRDRSLRARRGTSRVAADTSGGRRVPGAGEAYTSRGPSGNNARRTQHGARTGGNWPEGANTTRDGTRNIGGRRRHDPGRSRHAAWATGDNREGARKGPCRTATRRGGSPPKSGATRNTLRGMQNMSSASVYQLVSHEEHSRRHPTQDGMHEEQFRPDPKQPGSHPTAPIQGLNGDFCPRPPSLRRSAWKSCARSSAARLLKRSVRRLFPPGSAR
jgi:hypothetical protein